MIGLIASVSLACNAAALFAQVAVATGGAAWDHVGEITASGRLVSSGLRGTAELRDDIRDGRYARWSMLPVKGSEAEAYDGQSLWARDISGGVHPYDSWYPRARAVTEAFLTRRGYLDPHSGIAMTCVGFTGSGADRAEMVRVAPRGGIPAIVAVDTRSHLIDSVAVRTPITTDVTTFGDYRQLGRIVLPFSISTASLFEPANGDRVEVTRYAVSPNVRAADFERPRTEENTRMLRGASAANAPIAVEGNRALRVGFDQRSRADAVHSRFGGSRDPRWCRGEGARAARNWRWRERWCGGGDDRASVHARRQRSHRRRGSCSISPFS